MQSIYLILLAIFYPSTFSKMTENSSRVRLKVRDQLTFKCHRLMYDWPKVIAAKKQACELLKKNKKTNGFVRYPRSYTTEENERKKAAKKVYGHYFVYPILPSGKIYRRWSLKFWRRSEKNLIVIDIRCVFYGVILRKVVKKDRNCQGYRCKKYIVYRPCTKYKNFYRSKISSGEE
ncbi:CSEP0475 putative effector protein [Blumeria hordei DH14]|uniref:CSEP0475 putative effector protein n=1 Tax=Blumeria graminis f. sp. hordei (strain DH14) TaxID=546991 RepID=N1JJ38_BLUG1|nr:CSEP0475 putative effector protein [Blumeria hordei DH14]